MTWTSGTTRLLIVLLQEESIPYVPAGNGWAPPPFFANKRESPLNYSTEEEEKKRGLAFPWGNIYTFFCFSSPLVRIGTTREKKFNGRKKIFATIICFLFFFRELPKRDQDYPSTEINKKEKCFLGCCSIKEGKTNQTDTRQWEVV